jgi:hypothetical protein
MRFFLLYCIGGHSISAVYQPESFNGILMFGTAVVQLLFGAKSMF